MILKSRLLEYVRVAGLFAYACKCVCMCVSRIRHATSCSSCLIASALLNKSIRMYIYMWCVCVGFVGKGEACKYAKLKMVLNDGRPPAGWFTCCLYVLVFKTCVPL